MTATDVVVTAGPLVSAGLRLPDAGRLFAENDAASSGVALAPVPAPTVKPKRALLGAGPIVLSGSGAYSVGFTHYGRVTGSQTINTLSSGVTVTAERRTEAASLSVSDGFGYQSGVTTLAQLTAAYRTPLYGLAYGPIAGPSDTQLAFAGLARGVTLTIPLRNGDLQYVSSTSTHQDGTGYRLLGLRRNLVTPRGAMFSATGFYGSSEAGRGRQGILDMTYRQSSRSLATVSELAFSDSHGVAAADGAHAAAAFHADLSGSAGPFTSLTAKWYPAGLSTLGQDLTGAFSFDLATHRDVKRIGGITLTYDHLDQQLPAGGSSHDDRGTVGWSKSFGAAAVSAVAGLAGDRGDGGNQLVRTAALALSEQVRGVSVNAGVQTSDASGTSGPALQRGVTLGLATRLFGGGLSLGGSRTTSQSAGLLSRDTLETIGYARPFGRKLDLALSETFDRVDAAGATTSQHATTFALTRRLSSVVGVRLAAQMTHQSGIGGGTSTTYSANVVGPLAFGALPQSSGRINPRLPGVIRGIVTYSQSGSAFDVGAASAHGYNNALVVLDGRISQRTDAQGQFEFRFITPGPHTISLQAGTIAPGLIADRESDVVQVQGGQTVNVTFTVGNFAGVRGTVEYVEGGAHKPLGGVSVAVDGLQLATTGPDGGYSIGRLTPGAHTVTVVESSLPSTVALTSPREQPATVVTGASTRVDFVAARLGSIAGNVLYAEGGGFGDLTGAQNVYVVANPGDHAVITDEAGGFVVDNLPPGTYKLEIDKDTLPEGQDVVSAPDGEITVAGGSQITGVIFKLGTAAKNVVYTFDNGKKLPIAVESMPLSVPPGGLLRITAKPAGTFNGTLRVESDVFGNFPLVLDRSTGIWHGRVIVPSLAKGNYAFTVTAHDPTRGDGEGLVTVDPHLALITARVSPSSPLPGRTARVTAKILAPVEPGDVVRFEDGYQIALPVPRRGVYAFDIRLWQHGLPYTAVIQTKRGPVYTLSLR